MRMYLDHNATTPVDPAVAEAMTRALTDLFGNPSSVHYYGQQAKAVLDEALHKLSEKYRSALVLCYLEGKTQEEAARQLGCPLGTVRSRLAQGRKLLHDRHVRQL